MEDIKPKHAMIKGTFFLMIANLSFLICGYIIHFGLGRYFGPELYGSFGVVLSLLSINGILVQAGIPIAVSKYIAENEKIAYTVRNKALVIQLILSFIIFLFYFSLAPIIANLISDPDLTYYFRLSAIVIPIDALFWVYIYSLNGLRKFGKQAIVGILYNILKVFVVFTFVLLGYLLEGAIIGYTIASVLGLSMSIFLCRIKKSKYIFHSKKLIKFAIPLIVYSISITLLLSIDLLFVKAIIKNETLIGNYTSANFLSKIPYYIFLGLSATLLPSISKSITNKDIKQTKDYINHSLRYMLMIILPIIFVVSATSKNLINFVYGNQYSMGAQSLSILIFGITFLSFFTIFTTIITANNEPKKSMIFAIILIPIDLILNIILIQTYDLIGAAIATSITMFIGLIVVVFYTYRKFNTLLMPVSFIRIFLSSTFIYLLAIFFSINGIYLLFWYFILFIIYIIILLIFKEINKNDITLIKNLYYNTFLKKE